MGLWTWVMVSNPTFNNISVISRRQIYLQRKPEYQEKTTDLPQVIDKLYRIMLYRIHPAMSGIQIHNLVVISINCIGSYKSNYHTITSTRTPSFLGKTVSSKIIMENSATIQSNTIKSNQTCFILIKGSSRGNQKLYTNINRLIGNTTYVAYFCVYSSLRKLYSRHHDLVDRYGLSVSQITTDMFHLS
jgi:hypothetical protein